MWRVPLALFSVVTLLGGNEMLGFTNVRGLLGLFSDLPAVGADVGNGESSVTVSGFECANGYGKDLNQQYVLQGLTADGRPYYRGATRLDRFIYYDSYCAPDTTEPRWLLGGAPDPTLRNNLNPSDGNGCDNDFAIISDARQLPEGIQRLDWQWCGDHGLGGSAAVTIGHAEHFQPPAEAATGNPTNGCSKYASWGNRAVNGCKKCATWYSGREDDCMMCGRQCLGEMHCNSTNVEDCAETPIFRSCHQGCMASESADGCAKYGDENKVRGCKRCSQRYPGRTDECMRCGGQCILESHCDPAQLRQCVRNPRFRDCHQTCMAPSINANDVPSDQKRLDKGYEKCSRAYPSRADECMGCGSQCFIKLQCHPSRIDECTSNPKFGFCHKKCMYGGMKGSKGKALLGKKSITGSADNFLGKLEKSVEGTADPAWQQGVDWNACGKLRKIFFAKFAKDQASERLQQGALARLVAAGVPEELASGWVRNWVGYAEEKDVHEGEEEEDAGDEDADEDEDEDHETDSTDDDDDDDDDSEEEDKSVERAESCTRYEAWGERAMEGCKKCQYFYAGRVQDCMRCGRRCFKNEKLAACHSQCMESTRVKDTDAEVVGDAAV